ncbi:MAG: restriction endonuclease subunit S [Ferruginibacter sp.]
MSKAIKNKVVPKLRFPEFREEQGWDELTLEDIGDRIDEKVGEQTLTTVSISAGTGFVTQAEKFSRDISGQQYKNYIVLREGEFSYNKGNSKRFPQGCIYKLKEFKKVAVPNAFISFRIKNNFVANFYQGYFDNNFHGRQLQKFITSGARMDGLLNISPNNFFSIILPTPKNKSEQQKIADCLSSLDELITAENSKLEALKTHKKGLMQQLFPAEGETVPRLRFKEFRDSGEWEQTILKHAGRMQAGKFVSAAEISEIKNDKLYPCYGGNGLRGYTKSFTNNGSYSLIGRQGALCGNVTLADGQFHATEHAIVVTPEKNVETLWLFYMLTHLNLNQYATGQAQPGLSVDNLEKLEIKIPNSKHEQQIIADCLFSSDELIKT